MARQSPGWSMSPTNSIESEASGASFHSELLGKMVRPTGGGKYHEKTILYQYGKQHDGSNNVATRVTKEQSHLDGAFSTG